MIDYNTQSKIQYKLLNKLFNKNINNILIVHHNETIITYIKEIVNNIINNICNIASNHDIYNESLLKLNINLDSHDFKLITETILSLIDVNILQSKFIYITNKFDLEQELFNNTSTKLFDMIIIEDTYYLENYESGYDIIKWYKENKNINVKEIYITSFNRKKFFNEYFTKNQDNDSKLPLHIFYTPIVDIELELFLKEHIFKSIFAFSLYQMFYEYYNLSSNQIFIFNSTGNIVHSTINKYTTIYEFLNEQNVDLDNINTFINDKHLDYFLDATVYIERIDADNYLLFYKYNIDFNKWRTENINKYHILYNKLIAILDTTPDLIWSKDADGKYTYANSSMCEKLLIADKEEVIGKTDLFFALRERNKHLDDMNWHTFGELCINSDQIVLKNKISQKFLEYGNVQGEFISLDVFKSPLYDTKNNIIGTVGVGRDNTLSLEQECLINSIINSTDSLIINFSNYEDNFIIKYYNKNIVNLINDLLIHNIAFKEIDKYNIFDLFIHNKNMTAFINKAIKSNINIRDIIQINDKFFDVSINTIKNAMNSHVVSYTLNITNIDNNYVTKLQLEQSERILNIMINEYDYPVLIYKNKSITNKAFNTTFGENNFELIEKISKLRINDIFEVENKKEDIYEWFKLVNMKNMNINGITIKIFYINNVTKLISLEEELLDKLSTIKKSIENLNIYDSKQQSTR